MTLALPASGPTSRTFFSQRLRLHYVDWGNAGAPPLILLHGGQDHCRNWDWVAAALRKDWHVIAPDLRGHGDSAWSTDGNYTMAGYIGDLAQLIHQQRLAPVSIVAHSLGGNIALRYTGIYPDSVRRLVAIEGLGPSPRILAERADKTMAQRMADWIAARRALAGRLPRRYASIEEALARMQEQNKHLSPEQARHLTQQVVPLRPPPDPDLAADLAELRMMRADDSEWMSDPRAVTIRERARERQWTQTGRARLQERVSLGDLQDALDEQTALVAYVYTGDSLTALVVTRARADLVPLHDVPEARRALPGLRADLDMSASVRTGPMRQVVQRSLDSRLATLSSALLDEPARVAGTRRLVVTAPGVLSGIPWAMLPGMRGRVFTLAPSATRWAAVRESPRPSPVARVGFAVGPRVARGEEEVAVAASAWAEARILPADDATVDAVTDIAADVDVLHVAAHGRHAVDNPLFSGIELADGALFGYDIDRMPRVPETVVLSACEVGRSSVRWGEEAIGMTRIWLHAGVRDVVATPVIVADDVACELLGAMHEGLAAGEPPAEALAAASLRTGLMAPFQTHGSGF